MTWHPRGTVNLCRSSTSDRASPSVRKKLESNTKSPRPMPTPRGGRISGALLPSDHRWSHPPIFSAPADFQRGDCAFGTDGNAGASAKPGLINAGQALGRPMPAPTDSPRANYFPRRSATGRGAKIFAAFRTRTGGPATRVWSRVSGRPSFFDRPAEKASDATSDSTPAAVHATPENCREISGSGGGGVRRRRGRGA